MSLPHALLTSLVERPSSSGYDLARRFDSSIGFFWRASHQQIYRELARMERAGWVASDEAPGHTRKRVYRCLPAGRRELVRWTAEGGSPPVVRDALLVRMRAAAALGSPDLSGALEAQLRERLTQHEAALMSYREIEARDFTSERRSAESEAQAEAERMRHVILRAGIRFEESGRDWSREALAALDARDPHDAHDPLDALDALDA